MEDTTEEIRKDIKKLGNLMENIKDLLRKGSNLKPKALEMLVKEHGFENIGVGIDNIFEEDKSRLRAIAIDANRKLRARHGGEYTFIYDYVAQYSASDFANHITYYTIKEVLIGLKKEDKSIPIYRMRFIEDIEEGELLIVTPLDKKYSEVLYNIALHQNKSNIGYNKTFLNDHFTDKFDENSGYLTPSAGCKVESTIDEPEKLNENFKKLDSNIGKLDQDTKKIYKQYNKLVKLNFWQGFFLAVGITSIGYNILHTIRMHDGVTIPYKIRTVQEGYAVPAKLRLKAMDLDGDRKNQIILSYDNGLYYHLKFNGNSLYLVPYETKLINMGGKRNGTKK